MKRHSILDEVSPSKSIVLVLRNGKYVETFSLESKDFGVKIHSSKIQVSGDKDEILKANCLTLIGKNLDLANYLAMSSALGFYLRNYKKKTVLSVKV